ncbi:ETC complex I subunit conserved region-domain-containing protein [Globomyces pollinis-pini]|nr:ETC complex I subunit conserved region-domain-containing protein [Globomyces pollinis-pini]KAJ2999078.1 hypothetical protein HDV02_003608 [Globomyces sp. JEL0801]
MQSRFFIQLRNYATGSYKKTTGIVGIPVHLNARPELISLYQRINHNIQRIPATSAYRKGTEALVKERLDIVEKTESIEEIEQKIGLGQIEELLLAAEDEIKLIDVIAADESWKPLEETPIPGQWEYFNQK